MVHAMLSGACVQKITIGSILIALLLVTLAAPAQADVGAKTLVTWEATTAGLQDPVTLRLKPDDRFQDYAFRIAPSGTTGTAMGLLNVENAHGDLVCRGLVSHQGVLDIHRKCDGLRTHHTYTLTWITDQAGNRLDLYGSRPLV